MQPDIAAIINHMNNINEAVHNSGGITALARECGVSIQAIQGWIKRGTMPRTEWTGESSYWMIFVKLSKGRVTKKHLLSKRITPL